MKTICHLKNIAFLIGMLLSIQGCFLSDVLPEEAQKRKSAKLPDPPVVLPLLPKPPILSPVRLMRRLSIDIMGTLPDQKDIDLIVSDRSRYYGIAERLLNSSIAAVNVSQLHPRMWDMRADNLPDFDRFIAEGDSVLGPSLTAEMRTLIISEPLQFIRFQYENRLPFSDIFTAPYSFGTEGLMNLWGTTSSGIPWTGHPWNFTEFPDERPASGIIGSFAFLATIDSRGLNNIAFNVLSRFNCAEMENKYAHIFYEIPPADLVKDLKAYSQESKRCASCHRPIENAHIALKDFVTGYTFDTWKEFVAPSTPIEGHYNGQAFTGTEGWLEAFKEDPRIHRCEAQKLIGALNQRTYGSYDTTTISIGLARYFDNNESLLELIKAIVFSEDYMFDTVGPTMSGDYLRQSSGVRNLRRFQWKNILSSLHPVLAELDYPESLDPGIDEAINHEDMVPSGQYWSSVDRLARSAAEKIVEEELNDASTAITRRVFTALADKSGFGMKTEDINRQIRLLWLRLTGEHLDSDFVTYTAFQTLWAANKPEESEEKFRQAWRVVIVAMLTHPRFINY